MGIIKEQEQAIINLMQSVTDGKTIELAHTKALEFATLMSYYKCAMIEIEAKLNVLNVEYSLSFDRNPINSIKTRLKNPLSIKEKLERRDLPISIESIEQNIYDVAGIRVVCSFQDDVYMRRDLSRSVFAKQCAIRIDKQQKERYNNVVIDNDVII